MAEFKVTDAALEGFRIARENPKAFRAWVVLNLAVSVLAILIDVFMPAGVRHGLDTLNGSETLTLGQFVDTIILAAPVLILALAVMSIMAAAVYRLIFRHADADFGYVRLGADELRLMAVTLICFLIVMATVVAATVVIGLGFAIISAAVPNIVALVPWLGTLGVLAVAAFVIVRLSLAPVATFAERRLVVFDSWSLTRGHFWQLFGAYALAVACIVTIWVLVVFVCFGVAGSIVMVTGGQLADVKGIFTASGTSLRSYLSVGVIAYAIVNSIVSALYNAVIAAPGAVAYQQLHGDPPARPLTAQPEAG